MVLSDVDPQGGNPADSADITVPLMNSGCEYTLAGF